MVPLSTLLQEACRSFKPPLDPCQCQLVLNRKPLDASLPFRLANIPSGSRLDVVVVRGELEGRAHVGQGPSPGLLFTRLGARERTPMQLPDLHAWPAPSAHSTPIDQTQVLQMRRGHRRSVTRRRRRSSSKSRLRPPPPLPPPPQRLLQARTRPPQAAPPQATRTLSRRQQRRWTLRSKLPLLPPRLLLLPPRLPRLRGSWAWTVQCTCSRRQRCRRRPRRRGEAVCLGRQYALITVLPVQPVDDPSPRTDSPSVSQPVVPFYRAHTRPAACLALQRAMLAACFLC